jgi:flagellar M-ring protein FliF
LPNQNGFFREQQKASASVVLTLYPGRTLDRGQLAGIVHLVSSSVPEMSPKSVSVVDQSGTLLAGQQDSGADQAGLDAQQLQYVRQIESSYTQRVRDILEPVLGPDNLRAQVTADVDFSQVEQTAEEFKPNQGPNAATTVRSQQTSESSGQGSATPSGVPGAASNQPPAQATAPINGASAPLQAAGQTASSNSRRDAVTNYEVDRTVRVVRSSTGNIRRLTAAVVVNHRTVTDAKGKTTTEPLPQEELDKLTALVRESIGADDKRGDSIKVVSAPFQAPKEEVDDTPLWKKPETVDLIRTLAVPGALTLAALIVVFGAIRPAIQAAKPAAKSDAEANRLNAVVDDPQELPAIAGGHGPIVAGADGGVAALEGPSGPDLRLEHARKLAKENPLAMASMVRGWMNN